MAVSAPPASPRRSRAVVVIVAAVAVMLAAAIAPVLLVALSSQSSPRTACRGDATEPVGTVSVLGPGQGERVGATEYGGAGDPSSGDVGASGVNLDAHPDSYAELGGFTFATATAMGGLAYETPLRIVGRPLGDGLQARHRSGRRPDRRSSAGHRSLVAARGGTRDPL